jgi:hypothetical protein
VIIEEKVLVDNKAKSEVRTTRTIECVIAANVILKEP